MQTGSTIVRVVFNPGGGWDVREAGSTRAMSHFAGRDKAILRARAAMLNGGVVQVIDGAGSVLQTYSVPGPRDRAWWYIPSRPLVWVVGSAFFLQGIFGVAGRDIGQFRFWLGLVTLLMAGFYLVLVVISRRHDLRLLRPE